jgi:hypothetical protein
MTVQLLLALPLFYGSYVEKQAKVRPEYSMMLLKAKHESVRKDMDRRLQETNRRIVGLDKEMITNLEKAIATLKEANRPSIDYIIKELEKRKAELEKRVANSK